MLPHPAAAAGSPFHTPSAPDGGLVGVGEAIAILFAAQGARVAVADIDRDRAAAALAIVHRVGGDGIVTVGDLTNVDDNRRCVDEAVEAFRHVVSPGKAYCNIAFLMATQGRRDMALHAYREALRVEPDLQLARTALERMENGPPQGAQAAPQTAALQPATAVATARP